MKFRIIKEEGKIKVQRRFLFCWYTIGIETPFGKNEETYESVEEAERAINQGSPSVIVLKEVIK